MTRLSMVRGGFLPISLLLAIAGVGCGDGDGGVVDMGRDLGNPDQGQPEDMGPVDEGVDQGPILPLPQVRVVHAVSDLLTATNVPINGIRLCVQIAGLPNIQALPPNDADLLEDIDLSLGLPFRAVTPYQQTLPPSTVRVYDEARIDNDTPNAPPPAVTCPSTGLDDNCTDDAVPCLFDFDFDPSMLENGEAYSLFVTGFVNNTNTCGAGVACPSGNIAGTLTEDEGVDDVVAGSTRVRFFHGIPNFFPVDVCVDADGLGMGNAPVAIHTNVSTGSTSAYATVPAVTAAPGIVFLTAKTGGPGTDTVCGIAADMSNFVPVFFSAANAMAMPPVTTANLVGGTVITIFATGDSRFATMPSGTPGTNPIEWANYAGRLPLPLAFVDYAPVAP
jgi:hypothetical protein